MLKGGLQTNKYRNCPLVGSMHWCCILHDTPVAELVNKREWGVLGPGSIFSVTEYCYGELQYYCGTNDRNVSARQKKSRSRLTKHQARLPVELWSVAAQNHQCSMA